MTAASKRSILKTWIKHPTVLFNFLSILYYRLIEEADYKATKELFSGGKEKDEKNLDTFIPKSESDFLEYAELISHKLRAFEVS